MKKGFFYLALAAIIYLLTFANNIPDYDLWARLAVGSIFWQTGHLLKYDIFSYLPTKALWIDHEWGSSVVFYFFTKYLGAGGIFLLKAVIISVIFLLIIKIIKLQTSKYSAGIFYFIFLGFSLTPGIAALIRCQMFTYLFFTFWIYLLERVRRGENKLIWLFPATMLLWVNMHGGFLAGIGLIFIYALGELLNRKNPLKYLCILALIMPVTLINPYGWEFWNYIIKAGFMPRPHITEWSPITLSGPVHFFAGMKIHILAGFMIFACLTLLAGIKLLWQRVKPDWTSITMVMVLLFLSIKHQRHTAFFVLAVAGLFYHQYANLFNPVGKFIKNKLTDKTYKIWELTKYSLGYLLLAAICVYSIPKLSYNMMVSPFTYPAGSMEFIRQNNIAGNLATTYNWGSYAFWKLYPRCRILIDGRYEEVYSDTVYYEAMQFSEHKGDWQGVLRKYHTDILVLPKGKNTPSAILSLADWKPVYQDMSSVLLLPKDKIKQDYIYPDLNNPRYLQDDFSKAIPVSHL